MIIIFVIEKILYLPGRTVDIKGMLMNLVFINGFIGKPYVDGAHWYLTTLIGITFIMGLIYYFKLEKKVYVYIAWMIIAFVFNRINAVLSNIVGGAYVGYACLGIFIHKIKDNGFKKENIVCLSISFFMIYMCRGISSAAETIIAFLAVSLCIYGKMKILDNKLFTYIGKISYTWYLIHQNISYIMIYYLTEKYEYSYIYGVAAMVITFGMALMIYYGYENKRERITMQRIDKAIIYRIIKYKNEIGKHFWRKPDIASIEATIEIIKDKKVSLSRYGDGELGVACGYGNGFQKYDEKLKDRLKEILISNKDKHIVCLPDCFGEISFMKDASQEFHNGLLYVYRKKWYNLMDKEKKYYNAYITRFYNLFKDKSKCDGRIKKLKEIWTGRDILLVEGEFTRSGIGNDLYDNANSVKRILCPAENAFESYDIILNSVKKILKSSYENNNNVLVMAALGMTATVLCYDLSEIVQAIDIGHLDIEYEWYNIRANEKMCIEGKYVNEVKNGKNVGECSDQKYLESILCKINCSN